MGGIRDELEPGIMPRQLRELERVSARLESERPAPSAALESWIDEMMREAGRRAEIGRREAWACLGSGVLVLVVVALILL